MHTAAHSLTAKHPPLKRSIQVRFLVGGQAPTFIFGEPASLRSGGGARLHLGIKTFAAQKAELFIPPIASPKTKVSVIGFYG